jgi:hypothetical protein
MHDFPTLLQRVDRSRVLLRFCAFNAQPGGDLQRGRKLAGFCYQKVVRSTCMHGGSGRAGVHGGPQLQCSSHDRQERLQRGRKLAGFCYIAIVSV